MLASNRKYRASHQVPALARERYTLALLTIRVLMEVRKLNQPPVDLMMLSRALGINSVEKRKITPDAMLLHSDTGYDIVLKEGVRLSRTRFSWAHELAHLLLDRPNEGATVFRNVDDKAVESLCDDLAAEILMPDVAFSAEVQKFGYGLPAVPNLAARFGTSLEAAAIRLVKSTAKTSVLSKWQSREGTNKRRRSWNISSQAGVRIHFPSEVDLIQPIKDAFMYGGHANGKLPILVGRYSQSAYSQEADVQAFGFGAPSYRQVLSLATW